jgi:hypothetical protein
VNFETKLVFDEVISTHEIVIVNTVLNKRVEIISFTANTPDLEVYTSDGKLAQTVQTSLVWENLVGDSNTKNVDDFLSFATRFSEEMYEILFEASIEPLSIAVYTVKLNKLLLREQTPVLFLYNNNQNYNRSRIEIRENNTRKR